MVKRERPGTVTLTFEVPIEIAEWFAQNGTTLAYMAEISVERARREEARCQNKQTSHLRQLDAFVSLGRQWHRHLRRNGIPNNFVKNRPAIKVIADEIGVPWQRFELAVIRHKQLLEGKIRDRRDREIGRYYWAKKTDQYIADRLGISRNTVIKIIREVVKPKGRCE